MRSYDEIKKQVMSKGYTWFSKPLSLNFIWERTSYKATNIFDDWLHVCYLDDKGDKKVVSLHATTKPGLKGSLLEPVTVEGIRGTAIIEAGQYREVWQFRDTDKEFSKCPYFRQVGKLNYYRDGNKDRIIDKVNRQVAKLFGTHWHRMSNNNTYGSGQVNNWSLGCMGVPHPEWVLLFPIVRESVERYGDKFTGTIIDDFPQA